MKKIYRKIRRHPKPDKFWSTVLSAAVITVILVGVFMIEPAESQQEREIREVIND